MSFEAAVHAQAIDLDKLALRMCAEAGSGHPTTAMSIGHLVTVLMFHSMRWSPEHPDYPTSDRLVLSAGHAVPAVYAAYARLGGVIVDRDGTRRPMTVDDAMTLRAGDSPIEGHPNPGEGFPFFDAATGSLGQGLSVAAGIAEAARLDKNDRRVYCILGDGEAREGQVWEAVDAIVERGLRTVLPIFNCNGHGQAGAVSGQQSPERLQAKLEASGMTVLDIDGHAPAQIIEAFERFAETADSQTAAPLAVIARTVKGWGAEATLTGNWHGKPATGATLDAAIEELDQRAVDLTSSLASADHFEIRPPAQAPAPAGMTGDVPSMSQAMRAGDMDAVLAGGRLATRKAFGLALREIGRVHPQVVSLDADVSNSTFAETFAKDPACAERFVECKIAEQHMVSAAAGMAAAGKVPFVSTFAKFVTRAYDQIEMAILGGANIKVVGSHAGVTLAADGPSQMGLSDIAFFRSFTTVKDRRGNPAAYVLQPADAYAAYALTQAMAEYEGFCYMRTLRPEMEFLYSDDQVFNLGGFEVLSEGRDLLIVGSGATVHQGNSVVDALDKEGVAASLVDLYSLPFDGDALLDVAAANNGYVVTLEDNYGASIGSAVADVFSESGDAFTVKQMHVNSFPKSTRTADEALEMAGLDVASVTQQCLQLLEVGAV